MPMKLSSALKSTKTATVLDMSFCLLTLPAVLTYFSAEQKADASEGTIYFRLALCLAFLFMSLSRLFRARRYRLAGKPKAAVLTQLVYAGGFLVAAILPLFLDYTNSIGMQSEENIIQSLRAGNIGDVRGWVALVYWLTLVAGRVVALVHHRSRRSVLGNVVLMLILLFMAFSSFIASDMLTPIIVIVIQIMISIFSVAFGRFRLDVLKKIIRQTYASEIILGLLLLICSFGYILPFVDAGIPTFRDGLWYCFAIVTTIGFGDFSAVGPTGRLMSVVLGVYGIIVVAIITSIVVNFYGETKKHPDEAPDEQTDLFASPDADPPQTDQNP